MLWAVGWLNLELQAGSSLFYPSVGRSAENTDGDCGNSVDFIFKARLPLFELHSFIFFCRFNTHTRPTILILHD